MISIEAHVVPTQTVNWRYSNTVATTQILKAKFNNTEQDAQIPVEIGALHWIQLAVIVVETQILRLVFNNILVYKVTLFISSTAYSIFHALKKIYADQPLGVASEIGLSPEQQQAVLGGVYGSQLQGYGAQEQGYGSPIRGYGAQEQGYGQIQSFGAGSQLQGIDAGGYSQQQYGDFY